MALRYKFTDKLNRVQCPHRHIWRWYCFTDEQTLERYDKNAEPPRDQFGQRGSSARVLQTSYDPLLQRDSSLWYISVSQETSPTFTDGRSTNPDSTTGSDFRRTTMVLWHGFFPTTTTLNLSKLGTFDYCLLPLKNRRISSVKDNVSRQIKNPH